MDSCTRQKTAVQGVLRLVPKNWDTFQHYRDRCPPWIKLHRDLINDRAFIMLPTASKALAPLLWLLASESKDGSFNASSQELEFRLRMSPNEISSGLKSLIEAGFFLDASTMLAPCLQDAIPEREGEGEGEAEREADLIVELPSDEQPENQVKVSDVVEYWNEVADRIGKPKVLRLNDTRKQMVKTRIKQNSIDDFLLVFRNIERSSFLRNWKAMGFDWVFKAGNFQKILEGNYND